MKIAELFEQSPIIAAVKDEMGIERCRQLDCKVIFVLFGDLCNIQKVVQQLKEYGKVVIVHVDLIAGLSAKEIVIDFIKTNTMADGIISTKPMLVKRAVEMGLYGGQRTFVIDSMALTTLKRQLDSFTPDFVEIMPGVMPKVLRMVRDYTEIPLVAGGLLADKKDIIAAFNAGADAISTTMEELWRL